MSLFGNVRNRVPSKDGGLVKLDKTQSVERAEDNNYKKINLRKSINWLVEIEGYFALFKLWLS